MNVLRREGKLPAVIYGHNIEATPISLDLKETTKVLSGLTSSSLVTILLENKEYPALVRDRQRDYIRNRLIHLDFQVVNLTEKIRDADKDIAEKMLRENGIYELNPPELWERWETLK